MKKETYSVRKLVLGNVPELEITRPEFEESKHAWEIVRSVEKLESVLDMLIRNYEDFELECLKLALNSTLNHRVDWHDLVDNGHTVDRRLFNFLASARAYRDKSRSLAKRIDRNKLYPMLVDAQIHHEDTCFSFRLIESLRDHSQHAGITVSSLVRHMSIEDVSDLEDEEKIRRHVSATRPHVDVQSLSFLNSRNQRDIRVAAELPAVTDRNGRLDLLPHVRQYIASVGSIHETIRTQALPIELTAWSKLAGLIDRYILNHDDNITGLSCIRRELGSAVSDSFPLHEKVHQRTMRLTEKNSRLSHISKWIVSSELPARMREE